MRKLRLRKVKWHESHIFRKLVTLDSNLYLSDAKTWVLKHSAIWNKNEVNTLNRASTFYSILKNMLLKRKIEKSVRLRLREFWKSIDRNKSWRERTTILHPESSTKSKQVWGLTVVRNQFYFWFLIVSLSPYFKVS